MDNSNELPYIIRAQQQRPFLTSLFGSVALLIIGIGGMLLMLVLSGLIIISSPFARLWRWLVGYPR